MRQYKEKPREIPEIKLILRGRGEDGLSLKLSFIGNSLLQLEADININIMTQTDMRSCDDTAYPFRCPELCYHMENKLGS